MKNVVIIGCGPAGTAAAIQLKRSGLEPVVFERERVGGLLVNAHLVENYPGFADGIAGVDLAWRMEQHLRKLAICVLMEEVTCADLREGLFSVETPQRETTCSILVIASGTRPRPIASLEIAPAVAARVLYEIHPIRRARGRRIVIVGAGDAAFDYALSLQAQNEVVILNRGDRCRCLDLLWQRVGASSHISYRDNTRIESVSATPGGDLLIGCRTAQGPHEIAADYVVIAVGREPELGFVSERLALAAEAKQRDGLLYLIGDVKNGSMRQTAIAVGDGIKAAMAVSRKIEEMTG
jgi:thioredoxin reductase (NADPH)